MGAFLRLGERLLGRFPGSTLGSRWRRAFSLVALLMIVGLALETAAAQAGRPGLAGAWMAAGLAGVAVVYFCAVLVASAPCWWRCSTCPRTSSGSIRCGWRMTGCCRRC